MGTSGKIGGIAQHVRPLSAASADRCKQSQCLLEISLVFMLKSDSSPLEHCASSY